MDLLRDIALFVEVVKAGNFTRAAAQLDMPASTLSRRIAGLEQEIGLRLLNRTTRRVEVTDAGAAYFARCAHLVEEALIAHEDIAAAVNAIKGTLRLACPVDFAQNYLPGPLAEFTRQHPQVDVELDLSSRVVDLAAGQYDAALRLGPLPDSNLVARHIVDLQAALYAAPGYLRDAPKLATPDDLVNHACLRLRTHAGMAPWPLLPTSAKARGAVVVPELPPGKYRADNTGLLRRLALAGAGITAIDTTLVAEDVAAGRLQRVLPKWRIVPVPLHLLTPSRLVPARVRTFATFLANHLNRAAPTP